MPSGRATRWDLFIKLHKIGVFTLCRALPPAQQTPALEDLAAILPPHVASASHHEQGARKSFVSRRRSKFAGHPSPGAVEASEDAYVRSRLAGTALHTRLRNRYAGQHQLSKIDVLHGPEADRETFREVIPMCRRNTSWREWKVELAIQPEATFHLDHAIGRNRTARGQLCIALM